MQIHGTFCDPESNEYNETLARFFDEDGSLKLEIVSQYYGNYELKPKPKNVSHIPIWNPPLQPGRINMYALCVWVYEDAHYKVEHQYMECLGHIYTNDFWKNQQ